MKEKRFVVSVALILAICWVLYSIGMYLISKTFVLDIGGAIVLLIFTAIGAFLLYVTVGFIHAVVSD